MSTAAKSSSTSHARNRPPAPADDARPTALPRSSSWQHSSPLLLVTTAQPSLEEHPRGNLGRLVTPRHYSSVARTVSEGYPWAADNDCYQGLDAVRYCAMLDAIKPHAGTCLFVTIPDVVGDAIATAKQFEMWAEATRRRGLPAALVAQDGLEDQPRWLAYSWHRMSALFIGGSTEWKLGPAAAALAREAKSRGLWVHWGRVNTARRIAYIKSTGACDSFDGTKWARFRDTYLNHGLELAGAPAQMGLEL